MDRPDNFQRLAELGSAILMTALSAFTQSLGPSLGLNRTCWYVWAAIYALMLGSWFWEYGPDYRAAYAASGRRQGTRAGSRKYLPDAMLFPVALTFIALGFAFAG